MTACALSTKPTKTDVDADVAVFTTLGARAAAAGPPKMKQAPTKTISARVLKRLVSSCDRPPIFVLRNSSAVKTTTVAIANARARVAIPGMSAASDSPMTIEIAAVLAQVEIQSFQPTTNPA